ncbi:type I methionyl aminopeptidase [Candidatus Falkowbacteria bacterium]|nr:type I methionyl aminopeptidase [Candidatus Falkowbacteria bacterium]
MSLIKSKEELTILREGGKKLGQILRTVARSAKVNARVSDLNALAEDLIKKAGGRPSFKDFGGKKNSFPTALCVSINNEVVHGIPLATKVLKDGDIVGLDLGMEYKGLYTDTAMTVGVGKITKQNKRLIKTAEKALRAAIKKTRAGVDLQEISRAMQKTVEREGFSVVRQLVGHGVGHDVHEEPQIPNFVINNFHFVLEPGMVLAFEPMINAGKWEVETKKDGWTVVTKDGSCSAHFEHTVAVTKRGAIVITK